MRIGEVVRRTGIAAATIRAWQRRYGLLSPARSEGRQRLYSEQDVLVLRTVRQLVSEGWTLSAAAKHAMEDRGRREPDHASAPATMEEPAEGRSGRARVMPPVRPDADGRAPQTGGGPRATATERRPNLTSTPERDHLALVTTHDTARALLRATSGADVVAALVDLVQALGGEVGSAAEQDDEVLPIDLGLGVTDPMLPRAEPFSVARLRLEAVLPGIVEDARRMVALLRAAGR
jgi:DNA-binding transcriptional MerR regulator